jgi:glycine betaine/proline transport system permease protein
MHQQNQTLSLSASRATISQFVGKNTDYYVGVFTKIQSINQFAWTWNTMAALFGPFWGAARGLWGYFWIFMLLELFALVQLGKGLWGNLGAEKLARVDKLTDRYQQLEQKAQVIISAGGDATGLLNIAANLEKVTEKLILEGAELANGASNYVLAGIVILIAVKIIQGFYANTCYETQYLKWRSDPTVIPSGLNFVWSLYGALLWLTVVPMTLYRFTVTNPIEWLVTFPIEKQVFTPLSKVIDQGFDWLSDNFSGLFESVVIVIRSLLNSLETIFVDTPWPVVMMVILVIAWRLAGPRVAIFTASALGYLAILGLWETSMVTVALLGAAAVLCIVIGIPLGIWFGKNERAYSSALPVLDFMQTMPAFVYLIPIIAFFGTGKPPGIIATIIFGMPPVIRLTALGMRGVPEETKEAAVAFGATRWILLKDVEVPLAMPSIMTGINQTILMCLSMVVIASLIGAGGLGKSVLEALQYAAKGQGLLAGLAILCCAMVIDRIVQGHYKRTVSR